MSKAKFDAVRELITEGEYDLARQLLRLIGSTTSEKWLKRLDEIDPPIHFGTPHHSTPSTTEQEKYYERENRKARRRALGDGLHMVIVGLMTLGFWAFMSGVLTGRVISNPLSGMNLLIFSLGIFVIFLGILRINKRD